MSLTPDHASQSTSDLSPSIEQGLARLTVWNGEKTRLWEQAANAVDQRAATNRSSRGIWMRLARGPLGLAAILVLVVGLLLPVVNWNSVTGSRFEVGVLRDINSNPPVALHLDSGLSMSIAEESLADADRSKQGPSDMMRREAKGSADVNPLASSQTPLPSPDVAVRHIIRKATIELASEDVRAAFVKAQHAVRIDLGEFVESSSLTGSGVEARGQLVLRVSVTRLSEVLNSLRDLGVVQNEQAGGDDVTDQVVDLDARIRNEKCVEDELLALLRSRENAPLNDILQLRDKLSQVRQGIEQLQGRRDTIGRQVALATVIVILRPSDASKEHPKDGMMDRFFSEMSRSWDSALLSLMRSVAFMIRVVVGGALVWIAILIGALLLRRVVTRLLDVRRPDAPVLSRQS